MVSTSTTQERIMPRKILITGAGGGFGNLISLDLLRNGHTVVATMRDVKGKNQSVADELEAAGAFIVEIDVTNDDSVDNGIQTALEKAGGLDIAINNAGMGAIGLQESFSVKQWQDLFDINVFGVHRVTRALLPYFRNNNSGHLIFISSLLGRITVPFYGPYNASKWAVEAMAENYRTELSRYGIDVSLVEPGGFPTTFIDNLMRPGDTQRNESIGEYADEPASFLHNFEQALASNPAQDPQNVADAVTALVDTPAGQRPFRTIVDNMGMGTPIEAYNIQLGQITSGIYGAFGIDGMLALNLEHH